MRKPKLEVKTELEKLFEEDIEELAYQQALTEMPTITVKTLAACWAEMYAPDKDEDEAE